MYSLSWFSQGKSVYLCTLVTVTFIFPSSSQLRSFYQFYPYRLRNMLHMFPGLNFCWYYLNSFVEDYLFYTYCFSFSFSNPSFITQEHILSKAKSNIIFHSKKHVFAPFCLHKKMRYFEHFPPSELCHIPSPSDVPKILKYFVSFMTLLILFHFPIYLV